MSVQMNSTDPGNSQEAIITTKERIAEKEEMVRQLKLVKFYKEKHSLESLIALKQQWRTVCQQVLPELLGVLNEKNTSGVELKMDALLKHLDIPHDLVGYNVEDEGFV